MPMKPELWEQISLTTPTGYDASVSLGSCPASSTQSSTRARLAAYSQGIPARGKEVGERVSMQEGARDACSRLEALLR